MEEIPGEKTSYCCYAVLATSIACPMHGPPIDHVLSIDVFNTIIGNVLVGVVMF